MLDCLIVGGGPAGLTAAVYLLRYRRRARLVDAGDSRAALIPESHNYPGFRGIAGPDLVRRLRDQAGLYGMVPEPGVIGDLRREPDGTFTAHGNEETIRARCVLLATGVVDVKPVITGIPKPQNDAVRYCPICDGYEAIDKRVGVLGPLESAGKKALFLRTFTRELFLFAQDDAAPGSDLREKLENAGVTLMEGAAAVTYLDGDRLEVAVEDGRSVKLDVLYPVLGCKVRSDLAIALGAQCDENGNLKVDDHQRTTVEGLYAAGDVVSDLHQVSVAVGHAAIAATAIHNSLPDNPR